MNTIKIPVTVRTMKYEGNVFDVYETTLKDGTKRPLKFTKDVQNRPIISGFIICPITAVHDGKDRKGYRCVWVSAINEWQPKVTEESAAEELSKIFDLGN